MRVLPWRAVTAVFIGVVLLTPAAASADIQPPDVPTVPDPTPVLVDPGTTALAVLDINSAVCPPRPSCVASIPMVQRLLAKARTAGAPVVFSSTPNAQVLPDVAPLAGEPVVTAHADKFYGTNLDQLLRDRGVKTVVIVGSSANGAVLYTAFGANERGYTAVVAVDGISSGPDFDTFLAEYQLLSQPGFSNPTNQPLLPTSVTLSSTDLITFGATAK